MTLLEPNPALTWLFCMTHPDDEIAVCCQIRRLVANGNRVHVSWTHATMIREAESRRAMGILNVPYDQLHFLNGTDGSACEELRALDASYRQLMADVAPDRVVCGAFEQGHIDHDTTNYLVNRNFSGPIYEAPFYHTYTTIAQRMNRFSSPEGEIRMPLTREEVQFKKSFAKLYPSQNIWSVLMAHEAWQALHLRLPELAKWERFRIQTHFDFSKPNHPFGIAKRVEKHPTWHRWLGALESFEASHHFH